uniref:Uncharacterized protein n=1 Tax=Oryza glumipatula TaxID=40148 RepID=A0A0E0BH06_9ORYZ
MAPLTILQGRLTTNTLVRRYEPGVDTRPDELVPSPVARPPRGSRRRQAPAPPPVHSIAFSAAGRGAASVANGHRPRPAHAPPRAGAGPLLALTQKPQLLQYGKGWLGPPKRRDPSTQLQALLGRIRRGGWWAAEQRRPKTA